MMCLTRTVQLTEVKCWVCGCDFAVERSVYDNKQRYNKTLYCPNGCHLGFGETPEQKIRREMEAELARVKRDKEYCEARERRERERANAAEKSLAATKGVVTRIKNRVSKGVCPCCNRTFSDVQRHMATKHPEFATTSE